MRRLTLGAVTALAAVLLCSTVQAATISLDSGVVTFNAKASEPNDLRIQRGSVASGSCDFMPCLTIADAGAPITFGAPGSVGEECSPTPSGATCAALSATAHLGPGDDRALVSVHKVATVWGDAGDDDVAARGESGDAIAYGGPGDDRVEADGEGGLADGGPGDDFVQTFWNVPLARGGAGDDEIHFGASISRDPVVDGGPGDDRIFAWPARTPGSIVAGPGADYVSLESPLGSRDKANWSVDAGPGADVIVAGPGSDTVDAGAGADEIDVTGGQTDTVICGPGRDRVRADVLDNIGDDCEIRELVAPPS